MTDKTYDVYEDEDKDPLDIPKFDEPIDATGQAIGQQPLYDQLINAQLMLPKDGESNWPKLWAGTQLPMGEQLEHTMTTTS